MHTVHWSPSNRVNTVLYMVKDLRSRRKPPLLFLPLGRRSGHMDFPPYGPYTNTCVWPSASPAVRPRRARQLCERHMRIYPVAVPFTHPEARRGSPHYYLTKLRGLVFWRPRAGQGATVWMRRGPCPPIRSSPVHDLGFRFTSKPNQEKLTGPVWSVFARGFDSFVRNVGRAGRFHGFITLGICPAP